MAAISDEYYFNSTVRGYHVHKRVWNYTIGNILHTQIELSNVHDQYAVSLLSDERVIVSHVSAEQAKIVNFFLKHGGIVNAKITGDAINLGEGKGIEIPGQYHFKGLACKKKPP